MSNKEIIKNEIFNFKNGIESDKNHYLISDLNARFFNCKNDYFKIKFVRLKIMDNRNINIFPEFTISFLQKECTISQIEELIEIFDENLELITETKEFSIKYKTRILKYDEFLNKNFKVIDYFK